MMNIHPITDRIEPARSMALMDIFCSVVNAPGFIVDMVGNGSSEFPKVIVGV